MRTYYIELERQGNILAVVKVEAESFGEAKLKALEAWHANDDIGEISFEQATFALESGEIDYIIDDDGDESDLEDEEGE